MQVYPRDCLFFKKKRMCKAIAKKTKKKCKRAPLPNREYCYQHDPERESPKIQTPWTVVGLVSLKNNGVPTHVQARLRRVLLTGPEEKTDAGGFLYVYELKRDADAGLSYYKIGRTARSVHQRLKEWPGSVLVKAFRVAHNQFAERLAHLLLAYARVHRYPHDHGYRTVHATPEKKGQVILDGQHAPNTKINLRKKEVEWFNAALERDILPCLKIVARVVNKWDRVSKRLLPE